jgi:hypothetical protein
MDRRAFLQGVAALGAGAALAGCTASEDAPETAPPPPEPVQAAADRAAADRADAAADPERDDGDILDDVESGNGIALIDWTVSQDASGQLLVDVTVRNEGDSRSTALVQFTFKTDAGEVVAEQFVDLVPGEETTIRLTPEVPFSSSFTPRIRAVTPATPVPTDVPTPTRTPGSATGTDPDAETDTPGASGADTSGTSSGTETPSTGDTQPTASPTTDTE